jgi:hypothetical protein
MYERVRESARECAREKEREREAQCVQMCSLCEPFKLCSLALAAFCFMSESRKNNVFDAFKTIFLNEILSSH